MLFRSLLLLLFGVQRDWFYTMPILGICTSDVCCQSKAGVIARVNIMESLNFEKDLVIDGRPVGEQNAVD